jgi:glycosyltransferase involved in cell wall biosynthesis
LLGFQQNPYAFVANSDIIVQPSLFETFGLVYIEAFALKVPVIAFDVPAGNEVMENNRTGLLVPKGDSNLLAEKIIYLSGNPQERARIAGNAFTAYQEKFTTDIMIKNTASWYLANLKSSGEKN